MKHCFKCDTTQPLDAFHKNRSTKDGLQSYCKECTRTSQLEKYHSSDKRKSQYKAIHDKRKAFNQEMFWQYLADHPCPCGETNPLLLEIDHVDPLGNNKHRRIGSMINSGVSWSTIVAAMETEGCQVLCVVCHKLKTAEELDTWRWRKYNETL